MSIALMAAAWKLDIPMSEKMVLLCLCDYANDEGLCWPAIDTIAGKCSCTGRTVQNAIKALKARGLLVIEEAPGKSHKFHLNGRKIFTPELNSPLKMTTKGVKEIHPGGERASPKPSLNHQEPSIIPPTPQEGEDLPLTAEEIVEDWNELAAECGLPKAQRLTDSRKRRLQARLRQYPEVEPWRRAFATIRGSPFLRGDNAKGWRADFDFLLQDKSFTKLVEGAYGQA